MTIGTRIVRGLKETWAPRAIIVIVVLGVVEALVRTSVLNPLFVARPTSAIAQAVSGLVNGDLLSGTITTLVVTLIATAIAGVIGLLLGYWLWRSVSWQIAYEPLIAGLFASPIVLLYPIYLVLFGRNATALVALGVTVGFLPVALYVREGLAEVPSVLISTGRVYELNASQSLRHILVPAAAPVIFTGLRICLVYVLINVVAVEYLGQVGGLGKAISLAGLQFDMGALYAAIVVVAIITILLIWASSALQRLVSR